MKRKLTVLVAISAALTLAGCSQSTQGNTQSEQSKSSQVSKKSSNNSNTSSDSSSKSSDSDKLSAENMDYKTTASAIAVYASQKYGDTWEIAVNAAKQNHLSVALEARLKLVLLQTIAAMFTKLVVQARAVTLVICLAAMVLISKSLFL